MTKFEIVSSFYWFQISSIIELLDSINASYLLETSPDIVKMGFNLHLINVSSSEAEEISMMLTKAEWNGLLVDEEWRDKEANERWKARINK